MITTLTVIYLALFQCCAWPSIARLIRRGSSADLSVWREWMLLAGVACQFVVMLATRADWRVLISPVASGLSISVLLVTIYRHR